MAHNSLSLNRLAALQHRDYRLIWVGQFFSMIGSQMQTVAINWHIYALLRGQSYTLHLFGQAIPLNAEALGLGTLGLVRVVPIIVFALLGGMVADTVDRRRILIATQMLSAVLALILAMLTLGGWATIVMIYLITAATAAIAAFANPARQALIPNLVPRQHLTNAISLNTLNFQVAAIAGPALAGLMVGQFSLGVVYAVNALSFVVVIATLAVMEYRGQVMDNGSGLGWSALMEGLRFVFQTRIIMGTMLLDFLATFFSSARTMLPIVAGDILKVGPGGYGLLATADSVGALVAGALVSLRRDIHRQGVVLLVSVAIYGMATALFGLSTVFPLSYVLFALTGAADTVSMVIRGTIRQLMTPDQLRGRMTSVNMIFFMGGPQLGELEAGLVASALGVPFSIVSGGVATVLLTALIAWRYPKLRQFTRDMIEATPAM